MRRSSTAVQWAIDPDMRTIIMITYWVGATLRRFLQHMAAMAHERMPYELM